MRRPILFSAALAMLALLAGPTHAAEIKILTAGALKQVVLAVAPAFEQRTGNKVIVDNDTAGGLARRIATARQPAAAQAFIGILTGADGAAAMRRSGLEPVP